MLEGRFFLELSPDEILLCEGPFEPSGSSGSPWEIAILPFKPVSLNSPRFLNAKRSQIVRREDLSQCAKGKAPQNLIFSTSERALFTKSFASLKGLMDQGLALKGVPWAYQSAPLKEAGTFFESFLARIPHIPPSLALYGAQMREVSVLGASPEWLFRIFDDGKTLETVALAGTRWPGQNRLPQIENKDAFEHELVVKQIYDRLAPLGQVNLGERSWVRAASVEHLKTPIRLESATVLDPVKMLELLHPTPAVGVFPRSPEAQDWLYGLPYSEMRGDFAAPWVVRNTQDHRAWALVGIRQLRLRGDEVIIPAGCGVVSDSIEEVEWQEIQEKILSVKKGWGLQD